MATGTPVIEAHNLNVCYGDKQALQQGSLQIPNRQLTAIIGPIDCGKSTVLRSSNRMNGLVDAIEATEYGTRRARLRFRGAASSLDKVAELRRVVDVFCFAPCDNRRPLDSLGLCLVDEVHRSSVNDLPE